MTHSNICRLCINIFQEGRSLYKENGYGNELYEIICNYLHPKIVNMNEAKYLHSICLKCWGSIYDFHSFQAEIEVSQLNLLDLDIPGNDRSPTQLKEEDIQTSPDSKDLEFIDIKTEPATQNDNNSQDITRSDVEIFSESSDNEDIESTTGSEVAKRYIASSTTSKVSCKPLSNNIEEIPSGVVQPIDETLEEYVQQWLPIKQCTSCTKTFPKLNQLREHFRIEHPAKKVSVVCCNRLVEFDLIRSHGSTHRSPCILCGRSFRTKYELKRHVTGAHRNCKIFYCKVCGHLSDSYKDLEAHNLSEHKYQLTNEAIHSIISNSSYLNRRSISSKVSDDPVQDNTQDVANQWLPCIKCYVCSKEFPQLQNLTKHFAQKHVKEKFYIVCCDRQLTLGKIREHALIHRDPGFFKCKFCSKTYSAKNALKLHVNKKHPQCVEQFCKICNHVNKSYQGILEHYSTAHQSDPPPQQALKPNGYISYPCFECDHLSISLLAFYHHYWFQHRGVPRRANAHETPTTASTNKFQTEKSTSTEHCSDADTNEHQSSAHHNTIENTNEEICRRLLQCPDCGNKFSSDRDMIEHLASAHRNIIMYYCPCCPETFGKVTEVAMHRRKEHPQKNKVDYYKHMDNNFNLLRKECIIILGKKSQNGMKDV